jgi:hypothetical protein
MGDYESDARGLRNIALHLALVEKPSQETIDYFLDKVTSLETDSQYYNLLLQLSGSVIYSSNDSAVAKNRDGSACRTVTRSKAQDSRRYRFAAEAFYTHRLTPCWLISRWSIRPFAVKLCSWLLLVLLSL